MRKATEKMAMGIITATAVLFLVVTLDDCCENKATIVPVR